jgi:hypothetical protein
MWHRPDREPCVPVGPAGCGCEGMVHCWRAGLVTLPDGRWAVPHTCIANLHGSSDEDVYDSANPPLPTSIRFALWEPHRLCGVEAKLEGHFTIPSIFRQHDRLRVNYRCEVGGWLQLGLLRKNFEKIPSPTPDPEHEHDGFELDSCDLLRGDESDLVVTWGGGARADTSGLGHAVVIRVRMFRCKLFAYQV